MPTLLIIYSLLPITYKKNRPEIGSVFYMILLFDLGLRSCRCKLSDLCDSLAVFGMAGGKSCKETLGAKNLFQYILLCQMAIYNKILLHYK